MGLFFFLVVGDNMLNITAWEIADKSNLTSSQLLLLLTLLEFSESGICRMSVGQLVKKSKLSKVTVLKCIDALLNKSIITCNGVINGLGVKEYKVSCGDDSKTQDVVCEKTNKVNSETENCVDNLWMQLIANRKAKGYHHLTKDDEGLIRQAITDSMKATGKSYEDVMQVVIERGWSFVKSEWVVQALSKQSNNSNNSSGISNEIKQDYYKATQGNHTELTLEVTKRLGEFEVRTTPEQYMLPKWVSTYKKVLQEIENGDTLQSMKQRRRDAYLNSLK